MIPVTISSSFSLLYSSAYNNLARAFKGGNYNQGCLDLQKIYAVTDELFDAIRASLYSRTVNPESDIQRVYYNDIAWNLLRFRQLCKDHEQHADADLFLVVIRCFESLQHLAGRTKGLANAEGIELKPYNNLNLKKDYTLGGTYITAPEPGVKMPAKYYALYHWVLIDMGVESPVERNESDQYIKSKIEAIAREKYPKSSVQGFYRAFIEIDITKKVAIAKDFGRGYKIKIGEISGNNANVIAHLKGYPN